MRIKLFKRGKVREVYGCTDEPPKPRHLDLEYETQHYIVNEKVVLDKRTRAVMGFLFDNDELERIIELTKQSEREVDIALSTMFLGYSIKNNKEN